MSSEVKSASTGILSDLKKIVGEANVAKCDGGCGSAEVCVKPGTAKEVCDIVTLANRHNVRVTSSNRPEVSLDGKKGNGGILVQMDRFNSISDIDTNNLSLKVGVGCDWAQLIKSCSGKGYTLGSYPFDRSASVGSWAISNEVGFGTYKYGTSKDNVLNLEVVSYTGEILETGYDKIGHYMSGYNLTQMFSDSQGSMGIITSVTFKVFPTERNKVVAYSFESSSNMHAMVTKIVQHSSLRPRDMAWCSKIKSITLTLDGKYGFIGLEESALDAIAEETGGAKLDKERACTVCRTICKKGSNMFKAIIPLINWTAYMEENPGSYGTIADKSTVMIASKDPLGDKVCKFDGKAIEYGNFKWAPFQYSDETRKYADKRMTPEALKELKDAICECNVTTEGLDLLLYSKDMAPLPKEAGIAFNNIPDAVARPSTVKDVSEIVKIGRKYGIPLVPRGNSSWGLGGCMPTSGGIVVDFSSKMKNVHEINTEELYVKVDVGCTWKELLEKCMKKGYIIGSYPSSFPSATLGAWIATNGMGIGSYKYGAAKDNILNLEVILSDGTILETGNNHMGTYCEGFNLNQLFSGSEGTLCLFGTVTFRIYPMGDMIYRAYSYNKLKDMHGTFQKLVQNPNVRPLHLAFEDEMHFANQRRAGGHAPDCKSLLLATMQGDKAFIELETAEMDEMASEFCGTVVEGGVGEHEWQERCYEFRARRVGVGEIPAEIIVPMSQWGPFTDECYKGFDAMKMEPGGVIGVLADRNTALFMPYYFKDDESLLGMTAFAFNFYLGDRAMEYDGRTTGFGVFFAWNLDNIHNKATVRYMRDLKTILDPNDIVNPGHVVCGNTRFGIKMNKQLMGMGSFLIQTVKKILPKNTTFSDNLQRFRYDSLEHAKDHDRSHKLGDGTE